MGASLMHTDRRTDMTMVKDTSRNYVNVPKRRELERFVIA
jgi:hypothetical protein